MDFHCNFDEPPHPWGDNDNDPCLAQTFVFAVLEISVGLQMDVWMMDWKVSFALSKIRKFKKVTTGIKFWRVLNYLTSKKIDKNEFVKKYYRKVVLAKMFVKLDKNS